LQATWHRRGVKPLICLLVFAAAVATPACNNECDFFERCNGNVREICGDGADQVVNRKIRAEPCADANPICAQFDDDHARCVHDPATTCDDGFTPQCDGDLLLRCPVSAYANGNPAETRFLVAQDCTKLDDPSLPGYEPGAVGRCSTDGEPACTY
jgi:hypothetical protein